MLSPDLYYRSVYDIDLSELRGRGVDTLLIDLDNTLLPRNSGEIPERTRQWATEIRAAGVLGLSRLEQLARAGLRRRR